MLFLKQNNKETVQTPTLSYLLLSYFDMRCKHCVLDWFAVYENEASSIHRGIKLGVGAGVKLLKPSF